MSFPSRTSDFKFTAEPPSKRSKTSGPIYCLFPAEVEKVSHEVCEAQRHVFEKILSKTVDENKKIHHSRLRPKNQLIEKIVDENIGPVIEAISRELSISVREFVTSQIYDKIESSVDDSSGWSNKPILKSDNNSEQKSVLNAGEHAQKKRLFRKYQVISRSLSI